MKKIFTLFVVCLMVLSLNAQIKVGYFTFQKDMDATAATVTSEPVLAMLKADAGLQVTENVVIDASAAATADLSGYNVVVIQESFSGSAGILQPAGALGIAKLIKPTLYNKTYAFRGTRALPGANTLGTGQETPWLAALKVEAANQSNVLFSGITFTADSFKVLTLTANDLGAAGNKALNYAIPNTGNMAITPANAPLAIPAGTLTAGHNPIICVNDIPAGTKIGDATNFVTTASRLITLGINFGAMCKDNGTNITAAGLKLWKNAVYSLGSVKAPIAKTENVSFRRNGDQITVNLGTAKNTEVAVYNLAGMLISKQIATGNTAIIDLAGKGKGVYIIKLTGAKIKTTQKFAVN